MPGTRPSVGQPVGPEPLKQTACYAEAVAGLNLDVVLQRFTNPTTQVASRRVGAKWFTSAVCSLARDQRTSLSSVGVGASLGDRPASWRILHQALKRRFPMTPYRTKASSVVVTAFGGHIFGLDPPTGNVLWEHDIGGHTPRIIVTDTRVFAFGSWFLCLSYPSGEVVWRKDASEAASASLILSDGRLLSGVGGEVACYSAETGELLWRNMFTGKGSAFVTLGTPHNVMQADFSG
jgi:hypothetical protein